MYLVIFVYLHLRMVHTNQQYIIKYYFLEILRKSSIQSGNLKNRFVSSLSQNFFSVKESKKRCTGRIHHVFTCRYKRHFIRIFEVSYKILTPRRVPALYAFFDAKNLRWQLQAVYHAASEQNECIKIPRCKIVNF